MLISKFNTDIVCICEHWVSRTEIEDIRIDGFILASAFSRSNGVRGGTAIFLKNTLEYNELQYLVELSISHVCEVAAIYVKNYNLICIEVYRVPSINNFDLFVDCLYNVLNVLCFRNKSNASVILGGDFNVDLLVDDYQKSVFVNLLMCFNLKCRILDITRPNNYSSMGTCIDNIATSIHSDRIISVHVEPTVVSDHHAIIGLFNVDNNICRPVQSKPAKDTRIIRPIDEINVLYFTLLLSKVNWLGLYSLSTVRDKFEYFFTMFLNIVDTVFPVKYVSNISKRPRKPKWYSKHLSDLKEKCMLLYNMFRCTGRCYYRESYNCMKSKYKSEILKAKRAYYCDMVIHANSKPKAIWSVVNKSLGMNDRSLDHSKNLDLRCDKFNEFFINSVKSIKQSIPKANNDMSFYLDKLRVRGSGHIIPDFSVSHVSVEEVYVAILSLSNSTSLDVYCLNSKIIKLAAPYIADVLAYLFNQCIDDCVFPECLKLSKVVPLFKKGSKADYVNYRPVSIIPIIAKTFEVLLNNKLISYFESNELFSKDQFGFRPKRGTIDAIVSFMYDCLCGLDAKSKVHGNFYDMSKAFDTISHNILVNKLKYYGFSQSALKFFTSYLSDRYQSVYINGCFSNYLSVHSGVPQGSILGPTLFIIYVNDLSSSISKDYVKSYMYADDLAVQICCKYPSLVNHLHFTTSSIIEDWTAANSLCLNSDKTQNIEFSFKTCDNDSVKFLGLYVQSNVKWCTHVDYVCKKVAKGIFMLRKLRIFVNVEVLKAVYFAHLQSHMSYGIIAWGHFGNVKKLLLLQKRSIRVICNVNSRTHCKPLFKKLGILTVTSLYILDCLLYVKNNLEGFITNISVHGHFTRKSHFLRPAQCNFQTTINSFYEFGKRLYNMLPYCIKCLNVKSFKKRLKMLLIDLSVYDVEEFVEYLKLVEK